ncbi:MAG TPA: preprotein translocase subunit SecE [Clostridiaceae bacterium]|nr:preprotein translocase subunit SecE [Clostridiaceae bacterium]
MAENAKTSKLTDIRKRIVKFFKEIKAELKKVIWPTREQLTKSTITVLLVCLGVGIIIWISDVLLSFVLGLLLEM